MKSSALYILLFFSFNVFSQNYSNRIVSSVDTTTAVPFVSIYNIKNQKFSFSDEEGQFRISGEIGDTLVLNHLSFHPLQYIITNSTEYLEMDFKVTELIEIVLTDKRALVTIENPKKAIPAAYGIGIDRLYAFKVKNSLDTESSARSLRIPVNFRKGYNSKGKLLIQFFRTVSGLGATPLSKPFIINLDQIGTPKFISLEFEKNEVLFPSGDFFLVVQRVLLNEEFHKKQRLSVNPFFKIRQSSDEKMFYVKGISKDQWIEMNKSNSLIVPALEIEILVEKLDIVKN